MDSGDRNRYVVKQPQFEFENSLGETYLLQPAVLQNKFSIVKLTTNQAYQDVCFDKIDVVEPIINGGSANVSPPALTLNYSSNTASSDILTFIYITRQGQWDIPFNRENDLKFVQFRFFDQDGSINLLPAYQALFGSENFKAGEQITFWIRNLQRSAAQFSDPVLIILTLT
jgi:hypothetical protein